MFDAIPPEEELEKIYSDVPKLTIDEFNQLLNKKVNQRYGLITAAVILSAAAASLILIKIYHNSIKILS